jgi:hypothetical protein
MHKKSAFIVVVIKPRKMAVGMVFNIINAPVESVSLKEVSVQ